ncbi:hypothetical protein [Saccharothrix deserti]|nr:hypothetical protein [Saccharothrix deserti]
MTVASTASGDRDFPPAPAAIAEIDFAHGGGEEFPGSEDYIDRMCR